jgi:hypothetical protein
MNENFILEELMKAREKSEVFFPEPACDWRMSFGKESGVYFISIYPPFCGSGYHTWHCKDLDTLVYDLTQLTDYLSKNNLKRRDVLAVLFAHLRDKESIELFQEQRYLMELGLKHIHLDNLYQDNIRKLVDEFSSSQTINGIPLNLSVLGE